MSLAQCLREEALSLQTLVQEVLRKPVPLVVNEDNSACIQAIRKGYSPTLRNLKRTQRVSVAQLHETFEERNAEDSGDGPVSLVHAETKSHKGDVFTKYMPPAPYNEALGRLGVRNRRTRLAGGAARVLDVDGSRRYRRRRNMRNATAAATTTPTTQPANHNTNHNPQQQQRKQPRRRKRRRPTTYSTTLSHCPYPPTNSSRNSSNSSITQ